MKYKLAFKNTKTGKSMILEQYRTKHEAEERKDELNARENIPISITIIRKA